MTDQAPFMRRLAQRRLLARVVILFEFVWPRLWLPLTVIGVFLCLALLGVPQSLPGWLHLTLLTIFALAVVGLLVRGLRSLRMPDDRAADRRLELQSRLMHRPLSVLSDRPAIADGPGLAIWHAHAARAAAQLGRLRVGLPRPGVARRDPRAFRYAVLMSLIACLGIANTDTSARLLAALTPSLPVSSGAPTTEVQAWITPPAYTGVAPLFLKSQGGSISVPAGSRLTVNVSGGSGIPRLSLNDEKGVFAALDNHSFQIERALVHGGLLTVTRNGEPLATWTLTVIADQPPMVAWGEKPGSSPSSQQTRLPWTVSDDYGVVKLQAELRLQDRPDAPPLMVTIPLPGGTAKSAHGVDLSDLTAHPWAGLNVVGHLVAHDAPGQTGTSTQETFRLPERPFHNPIARILIAARKTLSIHPDDRGDALEALDGLMQEPESFGTDMGAFLNLSAIYYGLVRNHTASAIPEAQDMMWQLALHEEEGQTEQSARALEEARQAAQDAMSRAEQQPNDKTRQELEKKLEELRQAIERHVQALLEQAKRNNAVMPFDPKALKLSDQDMQRLAQQAEQSAKEGRMADAQRQMAELERMLDQLRNAQAQNAQGRQANGKQQRGKQQQSVVQDLIGREGGLLDHAQHRADIQPGTADQGGSLDHTQPRADTQPGTADLNAQRDADRRIQQALRRALGELMQQFADLSGEASPGLGEADQAMRNAITQLNKGDDGAAGQSQQQAIAALQKGNQEMGQAMAKMGRQPGQGDEGQDGSDGMMGMTMPGGQGNEGPDGGSLPGSSRQESGGRDPLGRYNQGSASDNADVTIPEQRERQRTQAIEEELRRRGADRERPQQELDYINRLLKQF